MSQIKNLIRWKIKILFYCIMIAGFFSPSITNATEYFVSKDGNDVNPGTKTAPVKSIRKGISLLSKSDKLYIRGGIYQEVIRSNEFTLPTGTSWENAPVIAAFPGEVVILQPNGAWEVIGLAHSYIQYIIFDGLIIDGIKLNISNGMGISMSHGANHVRFRNLEVKNAPINNVLLTPGTGGTDFNEFIGGKYHGAGWSPELKRMAYNFYIATNHNIIDGADVYGASGYGFHIYNAVDPRPNYNIVRNCRIYNNSLNVASSAGILLGTGNGNMAYNNLVYAGRGHGIQVSNGSNNARVFNNTIYENAENGIDIGNATNTVIKNNISYKNRVNYNNIGMATIESTNLIDGKDPGFLNPGNLDFHLKFDGNFKSPAIDAGLNLTEVPLDFEGNGRPQGSKHDLGAYECNQSVVGAPRNFRLITVN